MNTIYLYWKSGEIELKEYLSEDDIMPLLTSKELDFWAENNNTEWFYNKRKKTFQLLQS